MDESNEDWAYHKSQNLYDDFDEKDSQHLKDIMHNFLRNDVVKIKSRVTFMSIN